MNLEAQAARLQKELDELKRMIAQKKTVGRFKPEKGEWYEFIANDARVGLSEWNNSGMDNNRLSIGNVYRVGEAQAQVEKLKAITEINDWIDELNGDWVADWGDKSQFKFCIYFSTRQNKLRVDHHYIDHHAHVLKYCKDKDTTDKIISRITPKHIAAIWGI